MTRVHHPQVAKLGRFSGIDTEVEWQVQRRQHNVSKTSATKNTLDPRRIAPRWRGRWHKVVDRCDAGGGPRIFGSRSEDGRRRPTALCGSGD